MRGEWEGEVGNGTACKGRGVIRRRLNGKAKRLEMRLIEKNQLTYSASAGPAG